MARNRGTTRNQRKARNQGVARNGQEPGNNQEDSTLCTFGITPCFEYMKLLRVLSKGVDFDHGFQDDDNPVSSESDGLDLSSKLQLYYWFLLDIIPYHHCKDRSNIYNKSYKQIVINSKNSGFLNRPY